MKTGRPCVLLSASTEDHNPIRRLRISVNGPGGYGGGLRNGEEDFLGLFPHAHCRASIAEAIERVIETDRPLIEEAVAAFIAGESASPYDTHPVLRERISALEALPDPGVPDDSHRFRAHLEHAELITVVEDFGLGSFRAELEAKARS